MDKGDFFASELSWTAPSATSVSIEFVGADGSTKKMKEGIKLLEGEVIDSAFMSVKELRAFYERELQDASKDNLMVSLHLKATMMKVSDPIFFGHCVTVYFKDVFEKHAETFKAIKVNANNGLQAVYDKLKELPEVQRRVIEKDIDEVYAKRPWLAMVNSRKGITNLHVPSDVIVDASMPCVVR